MVEADAPMFSGPGKLFSIESLPITLLLLLLGFLFVFYGRKLVKMLVFLMGGIVGGYLLHVYLVPLLGVEEPYSFLLVGLGFLVAGLLAIKLIQILASLIAGYVTYDLLRPFFHDWTVPLVFAIISIIVVFVLFSKIVTVGTAVLGSVIVTHAIRTFFGLDPIIYILLVIVLSVIGSYYQLRR